MGFLCAEMDDLARLLCWTLVAKGLVVIWQKPYKNHCYEDRAPGTLPLLCDESDDRDAVWYGFSSLYSRPLKESSPIIRLS